MRKIKPTKIVDLLTVLEDKVEFRFVGNTSAFIENVSSVDEATEGSITWLNAKRLANFDISSLVASLIVVPEPKEELKYEGEKNIVFTENPRLVFALLVNSLIRTEDKASIHHTAIVSPEAQLHEDVAIGPGSVLGKCVVGKGSRIGANCILHDGTIIGENVVVGHGTIIGGPGFGYERDERGEWVLFPHIGGVIIEDNVEIGANTCIDRGALGNTWLKRGCKVDNLVHIAHNVVVEENALVIAHAMVAGSVIVGKDSWVAPGALIKNGLRLGSGSVIGLGAVVVKDVPDNETWIGNPAKQFKKE